MKNCFAALALIFSAFLIKSQVPLTDIKYTWDVVKGISLYHYSDVGYCNLGKLRKFVAAKAPTDSCNWGKIYALIKSSQQTQFDVALQEECIAIKVDFGDSIIPFMVFKNQGVLYDLREGVFQYLSVSNKELFRKTIEDCLNENSHFPCSNYTKVLS